MNTYNKFISDFINESRSVPLGSINKWQYTSLLKTLFNIVEERLKKLLNFDVSAE